jgi:glycosyltransferase involved in cell wall biosynthesis
MHNFPISVVMPVYNGGTYLADAIQSILIQTYQNFEFIIINDGSTDNSLEVISEFQCKDNRIRLISRENKGLVASLNEGIQASTGQYIARMDADDICLPERFEKQVNLIATTDTDICGCHFFIVDETSKYIDSKISPVSQAAIVLQLATTVPFAHGSVMVKREVIQKYMYGNTGFQAVEDYALWLQMFEDGVTFGNVDSFLFKYRNLKDSFSKTKVKLMDQEQSSLSKRYVSNNRDVICRCIDEQLRRRISSIEEIFLMRVGWRLGHKRWSMYKHISKMSFIIASLKALEAFIRRF